MGGLSHPPTPLSSSSLSGGEGGGGMGGGGSFSVIFVGEGVDQPSSQVLIDEAALLGQMQHGTRTHNTPAHGQWKSRSRAIF